MTDYCTQELVECPDRPMLEQLKVLGHLELRRFKDAVPTWTGKAVDHHP